MRHGCRHRPDARAGSALRPWVADRSPYRRWGIALRGEEGDSGEHACQARNTARQPRAKPKRAAGKAAGNPSAQAKGGAEKKKANLKQAGEKVKDTAKK